MALFAQHPTDGVHDIRLSAAVGPDDTRGAGPAEGDDSPFAEGLEAYNLDFTQLEQGVPFVVNFHFAMIQCAQFTVILEYRSGRGFSREERRLSFPRWEDLRRNTPVCNRQKANTFGRFSVRAQPPGAKMAVRELRLTWGLAAVKPYPMDCGPFFHTTRDQIDWICINPARNCRSKSF